MGKLRKSARKFNVNAPKLAEKSLQTGFWGSSRFKLPEPNDRLDCQPTRFCSRENAINSRDSRLLLYVPTDFPIGIALMRMVFCSFRANLSIGTLAHSIHVRL